MNTRKKIVLVEDDDILSEIMAAELNDEGFDVTCAMDGEEALVKIEEALPDLVLLDMLLPKKRGTEVLEELQGNPKTAGIPVIILTMLGNEEEIKRCKALGIKDYIIKSQYELKSLGKKVSDFLTAG